MTLFDELQAKVESGDTTWEEIYNFIEAMIDSRNDNDYCEKENCNENISSRRQRRN